MTKKKKPVDFVEAELAQENPNHNSSNSKSKKNTSTKDFEFDSEYRMYSFKGKPINLRELADRMKAYGLREADPKNGIRPGWTKEGFCVEEGIRKDSFPDLVAKHPILQDAYIFMMQCLAERRDYGASTKEYDGAHIRWTLGRYMPEFVEEQNRIAKLSKDNADNGNKVVVIESLTCGHIEGSK